VQVLGRVQVRVGVDGSGGGGGAREFLLVGIGGDPGSGGWVVPS